MINISAKCISLSSQSKHMLVLFSKKILHTKWATTWNKVFSNLVPSQGSNQPAWMCRLIWVFAGHLQLSKDPRFLQTESGSSQSDWLDTEAYLSLCRVHICKTFFSYCGSDPPLWLVAYIFLSLQNIRYQWLMYYKW